MPSIRQSSELFEQLKNSGEIRPVNATNEFFPPPVPLPPYPASPSPTLRSPLPAALTLQPDSTRQYFNSASPQTRISPLPPASNAAANASAVSQVLEIIETPSISEGGMNWRGEWSSVEFYAVDDVVIYNKSVYIAIENNTNIPPYSDISKWTLIGENFNYRGEWSDNPLFEDAFWFNYTADGSGGSSPFVLNQTPTLPTGRADSTFQPIGKKIIDSNGNLQVVTTPGISGSTSPTWNTTLGGTTTDGGVIWTNRGTPYVISVGDKIIHLTLIDPQAGTVSATSVTDSLGHTFNLIATADLTTVRNFRLQVWMVTSEQNLLSGSSYSVTTLLNGSVFQVVGRTTSLSNVGDLLPTIVTKSNISTSAGIPFYAGPMSFDVRSLGMVIFYAGNTLANNDSSLTFLMGTSGGNNDRTYYFTSPIGESNPFNTINFVASTASTVLFGFPLAEQENYLPYDLVEYEGSAYVCVAPTNGSPETDTSSWQLLAKGSGGVRNIFDDYTPTIFDDGRLITHSAASNHTLTLPGLPYKPGWWIAVQNIGTGNLTINPNGNTIDASGSNITLTAGQGLFIYTDGARYFKMQGWVQSVGLSMPSIFTVSNSPVTTSGTLTASLNTQSANTVFAGPASGSASQPSFRELVAADLPIFGVNARTGNYTAVSGDFGKLITFSSSSAVTLTLPSTPPSSKWAIFVQNVGTGSLTINRNGRTIDGASSNLTLTQDQGVIIFTDGTNYFTSRGVGGGGSGAVGGVNSQTGNYTALSSDNGKLISFTLSSASTLTLPDPPISTTWWIAVQNVGSSTDVLTIDPQTTSIDGVAASVSVSPNDGIIIFTDGTDYFTSRGMGGGGINWLGTWNSGTNYAPDDAVEYNGSSYISISNNINQQPDSSPSDWNLMAAAATGVNATQLQGVNISTNTPNDGDALVYDSGTNEWTPTPVSGGGVAFQSTRRRTIVSAAGSGTTIQGLGDTITASFVGGGQGLNAATDALGMNVGGNAGTNTVGSYSGNLNYRTFHNPSALFYTGWARNTDTRYWIGLTDQTGSTMGASDNPAGNYAAFRFSTSAGDTTWKAITKNGSTQTVTDTGVSVTGGGGANMAIVITHGSSVKFYIDGTLVATNTTNLPSNTNMRWVLTEISFVNNTGNGISLGSIIIDTDR